MDLDNVLKVLHDELVVLNESIAALERMAAGRSRGRGRPPNWLSEVKKMESEVETKRRRRPMGSKNKRTVVNGE